MAQIRHSEKERKEVERRLDDDGRQFLEALLALENELCSLAKRNTRLEAEKAELQDRLAMQESDFKRQLGEVERHRDQMLTMMTEEGRELQARVDKFHGDNEKLREDVLSLTVDLTKAAARADAAVAGTLPNATQIVRDQEQQLRSMWSKCELLRDEVTDKQGELALLRSRIEIAERKLKLSDMEKSALQGELQALRQNHKTPLTTSMIDPGATAD